MHGTAATNCCSIGDYNNVVLVATLAPVTTVLGPHCYTGRVAPSLENDVSDYTRLSGIDNLLSYYSAVQLYVCMYVRLCVPASVFSLCGEDTIAWWLCLI